MILTVIMEGISKAATVLSALMEVYTVPCHDRCHMNVMLVLQSCSDSLPSSSYDTNATSGGVGFFCNLEVRENVIQEEIPGEITLPDTQPDLDEVSYFFICLVLDTFCRCRGIFSFGDVSICGQLKQLHCWR